MEWTGYTRWIYISSQVQADLDWTGSEIPQLSGFWTGLDREMYNVYPIFRYLRQFLLIVTLTSEVLLSNLQLSQSHSNGVRHHNAMESVITF